MPPRAVTVEDVHGHRPRARDDRGDRDPARPTAGPVEVTVRALGQDQRRTVDLGLSRGSPTHVALDLAGAAGWSPEHPVLHSVEVEVRDGTAGPTAVRASGCEPSPSTATGSDSTASPFPIRAALVQGFRADTLYAEGRRDQIEAEVRAAQEAGLNTLRLHIKAFDPVYLDVCDEFGMLVHADIPVAEPIAHDELGAHRGSRRGCAQP